jgi:hypothetical protein
LERYGSCQRGAEGIRRLAGRRGPSAAAPAARVQRPADTIAVLKLFEVMQKHAKLVAGELMISRKNQESLCWVPGMTPRRQARKRQRHHLAQQVRQPGAVQRSSRNSRPTRWPPRLSGKLSGRWLVRP